MKRYKLNINRSDINPSEIEKGKNFENLLAAAKPATIPLYRNTWFIATGSVAAAAIIIICWFSIFNKSATPALVQTQFIAPPLKNVDVPYNIYEVVAETGQNITCISGSRIHIPANAFTDAGGNIIKGKVQLKYREFRDAIDFFVSGIPMTYDSGGIKYTFQSAGMCEILAFQEGKILNTNVKSPISIDFKTANKDPNFNLYKLDTVAKNWANIGKPILIEDKVTDSLVSQVDTLSFRNEHKDSLKKVEIMANRRPTGGYPAPELDKNNALANIEPQKPLEPKKADIAKPQFTFGFDSAQHPEMASYKNLKFELEGPDGNNPDAEVSSIVWTSVKLEENKKGVDYKLTLSKGSKTYKGIIKPVFEGADYDNAMKLYKKKFAAYKTSLARQEAEKKKWEAQQKEEEKQAQKEYARRQKENAKESSRQQEVARKERIAAQKQQQKAQIMSDKEYEKQQAALFQSVQDQSERLEVQNAVYESFTIQGFGYFNCDRPITSNDFFTIRPVYKDTTGKEIAMDLTYMADNKYRAIFEISSSPTIKINPSTIALIWGVTEDKKLVYIRRSDIGTLYNGSLYEFKMHTYHGELKSEADVRKLLALK